MIETRLTDIQVVSAQVQELDQRKPKQKVVVVDSLYGDHLFLAVSLVIISVFRLVCLLSNQAFYGPSKPYQKETKGAPAKHGTKFKLYSTDLGCLIGGKRSC